LLNFAQTLKGLPAIVLDVGVHDLQLQGDVFDGGSKADDGISRFIVAFADAEGAHRCYGNAGAGHGRENFDHGRGCYSSSLAQRIDAGEGAVAICGSVLRVEDAD
jgi:hypothetical protein